MPRPTLDGIKQASAGALNKAQLMVGLKSEEQEEESQASERSGFLEDAADIICPDLTFQQRIFHVCLPFIFLLVSIPMQT